MVDRVVSLLAPAFDDQQQPVLVDATLGMGGHTEAFLNRFDTLQVIGIDRDPEALRMASERLAPFGERFSTFQGTYDEVDEALASAGIDQADAFLYDLGVSSYQLDEKARGFAYSYDAPLDMRMDPTRGQTAADIVNTYSARDLERVLKSYGEEKFTRRIVNTIVERRESTPFETTKQLVDAIFAAIPAAAAHQRTGGHPAKRTFQALRVEVNDELGILRRAMPAALNALRVGGRLVAMSYQSLEDKIVKDALRREATSLTPPDFPVELEEHAPVVKIITRGTEKPTQTEIDHNPRAASARVRAAEKIRPSRSNG